MQNFRILALFITIAASLFATGNAQAGGYGAAAEPGEIAGAFMSESLSRPLEEAMAKICAYQRPPHPAPSWKSSDPAISMQISIDHASSSATYDTYSHAPNAFPVEMHSPVLACVADAIHEELRNNTTNTQITITQKLRTCEDHHMIRISAQELESDGFSIFRHAGTVIATKTLEKGFGRSREIRILLNDKRRVEGYVFFHSL